MARIALTLAGGVAGFGLLLGGAAPALAHAHLKSASPGVEATVHAAPKTLELTFSESVVPKLSGATLADAAGKPVALGAPSAGSDAKVLSVPVTGTLAAGAYTVTWHAVATDTHRTKGSFRFTVAP